MIDEATLAKLEAAAKDCLNPKLKYAPQHWLTADEVHQEIGTLYDGILVELSRPEVMIELIAAAREREQLRQYWYSPDLHEEICEKLKEQIVAVTAELEQLRGELEKLRKEIVWNESMQSVHMQCISDLRRERDEARDQRDGLMAQVELLAYERDEARTALDMQRQATDAAQSRAEEARRELAEVQS